MRARATLRLAVLVALLAVSVAGCTRQVPRTSTFLLERETGRAFEDAYEARHRMTTERAEEDLLAARRARCRKLEPPPPPERPWHWSCAISYRPRGRQGGRASYRVTVDQLGCFAAVSTDFPPRVYERILRRRAPNPLARLHSCP